MLLAPVWLQIVHLLGAELLWVLVVLASTSLLFAAVDSDSGSEVGYRLRRAWPKLLGFWFERRYGICKAQIRGNEFSRKIHHTRWFGVNRQV